MDVEAGDRAHASDEAREGDEALGAHEGRLRLALDAAALGAWLIDVRDGSVELNARTRALYGIAADEPLRIGDLAAVVHPDDLPRVREAALAALDPAGEGVFVVDHRPARPTAAARWVRLRARASFAADGVRAPTVLAGTAEDIGDEMLALEDGQFLLALGARLPTITEPDAILHTVLEQLVAYLGVPHAMVVEVDPERERLVILADASADGWSIAGDHDLWAFTTPARLDDVVRGGPLAVADTERDPRTCGQYAETYGPLRLRAYLTSPQFREAHFAGGLSVADRVPRQWTDREVGLVSLVAERLWPVFENARLLRAVRDTLDQRDHLLGALRHREAAFRAAFDHVSVGMAQLSLAGELTRVNDAFCAMLGYDPAELAGRTLLELTHPEEREGERARLARLASGQVAGLRRETRYLRRDGRVVLGECSASVVRDDAGSAPYILAAITDVTARREAETHLAATATALERLQRVTARLSRAVTVGQVCETLVTVGRQVLDADAGLVVLLGESGDVLSVRRVFQYGPHLLEHWRTIPLATHVPVVDAVTSRTPVWIASRAEGAARYPILADDPGEVEHQAWAALPLVVETRALGAIGVSFRAPREFSDEYRSFALALAQQCAQALERARLYEAERQARADAEDARVRAEAANRSKSDFLAVMSHELRTPLNAIGGYAQLLQMGIRGPVTPEQLEDLERIQRSQRTLLGLINDVLSFAKLESGSIDYHVSSVALSDVLAGLEALVRPQLAERALRYRHHTLPGALTVRADRDRMMQILLNLLTNAVKFTPAGGEITVWAERQGSHAAVHVRDTGRGIPAHKLELIFQPFVQVDTRLTRESGGIGLGLAISRDLARAMGGDLTVESVEGEGATFTLMLPVEE